LEGVSASSGLVPPVARELRSIQRRFTQWEGATMMMFLMILLASVPVLVLSCILFGAAARQEQKAPSDPKPSASPASAPRFFAGERTELPAQARFAVDALLSQIERHVRLEQAAAESFLDAPTEELLRSRTSSPFMN
jgi:hypothetical protein